MYVLVKVKKVSRINLESNLIIEGFSLFILIILYLNVSRSHDLYLFEQKLFVGIIFLDVTILLFDIAMWLLDGKAGYQSIYMIVTVCYFILNPVICFVWYFYADYQIYESKKRLKKLFIPMLAPVFINVLLSILSIFNGALFYIDENNIYHRGHLFFIMAVICFAFLFYTEILIIFNRKRIPKKDFRPLLSFAVPPIIGGVLQTMFYGISLLWPCVTLSILIIFINLQNDQIHKDYLTGLFNRRELDRYLQYTAQSLGNRLLFGIMIDVDSFKKINDIYGHGAGDQALQHVASILKITFRKSDFIARYGGDEFVVLAIHQQKESLSNDLERLYENVEVFNAQRNVPYEVSLSIGHDCYQSEKSPMQFMEHLDELMYRDKRNVSSHEEPLSTVR